VTRLRTISPVLAGLVAIGVAVPAAAASAAPVHGAVRHDTSLTAFSSQLLSGISSFTDLGAVDPAQQIEVDISLARPDAAGEQAYVTAEYTPGNPLYHQFLTPATFAAKFGVAQSTYDEALAYGTAHGMSLLSSTPARDLLVLTGTAAQAEATFGTTLRNYTLDGTSFYANPTAAMIPADLPVDGLFGLESMHRSHIVGQTDPLRAVTPKQTVCAVGECLGDVTPQDMWSIYDQPSTDTGQNQKLSLFGEGAYIYVIKDLRQFEKEDNLPEIPVHVNLADGADTGTNYTDTSGDGEWQLDTQSSSGMAPNASELDMVWGKDFSDASTLNVLSAWVNDPNGSRAASASYGECEPTPGDIGASDLGENSQLPSSAQFDYASDAYVISYEKELTAAVAMGKTLFSSSGDNGSSCGALPVDTNGVANEAVPGVGYPASSPNAVAVGGTVLYGTTSTAVAPATSNSTRFDEYAWTFSGGGPSNIFPEPAYQKDAATADTVETAEAPDTPCITDTTGAVLNPLTAPTCRKDPDVSAISGDVATNGYNIVDDGSDSATGGTSLSSPLTLGLWTRIESACGGNGPGYANYTFYQAKAGDFFDPGGLTDSTPSTNGAWQSTVGYDYATGLGVIDVAKMMTDVCGTQKPGAAPTDETASTTIPDTALPEATIPATLLGVAAIIGATVIVRRRRKAAQV
jgi:subtilase family serine protease